MLITFRNIIDLVLMAATFRHIVKSLMSDDANALRVSSVAMRPEPQPRVTRRH